MNSGEVYASGAMSVPSIVKNLTLTLLLTGWAVGLSGQNLDDGKHLLDISEYDAAKAFFLGGLVYCTTCPDSTVGYLHIYLAKSHHLLDQYDSALIHFKAGIDVFDKTGHWDGKAFGLISLAEMYRSLFQFDKALTHLKLAEELHKKHGLSLRVQAYLYNRYAAVISESTNDEKKVIEYSEKVIEMARKMGDRDMEANSLNELGYLYEKRGDLKSLDYFTNAYDIYWDLGNIRYATSVLSNLARASFRFRRYHESLHYAEEGIKMAGERKWLKALPELYYMRFENLMKQKRTDEAFKAYADYHRAELEARESEWNQSMFEIETRYDLVEKNKLLTEKELNESRIRSESDRKSRILIYLLILGIVLGGFIIMLLFASRKTRQTNELLNQSLRQTDMLRREMHHRVKNNLTFLKGILYLRSKASDRQDVKLILDECQARINAMALVHQNLYDVDNISEVDFTAFVRELFLELLTLFDLDERIEVDIESDPLKLDMNVSIFVGLILNELFTNSIKYAFTGASSGKITIHIKDFENEIHLTYSDSGKGLKNGFDLKNSQGFGFKIINILVDQTDAKMVYESNTFQLTIPK
jgi:two-component system, sensor histidine kinase PdtaS